MTTRGTWKAFERAVATRLGGKRIPVTGIDRDGADVITELFAVQTKLRKRLPQWLFAWLDGICLTARPHRIGVLILRTPHMDTNDALVIVRLRDWVELHGEIPKRL